MEPVYSLCNAYPKIFGDITSNITFHDIEIHEATDTIVSCGTIQDTTIFSNSSFHPLIIVSSLTSIDVKLSITYQNLANYDAKKVTISPNGEYIAVLLVGIK